MEHTLTSTRGAVVISIFVCGVLMLALSWNLLSVSKEGRHDLYRTDSCDCRRQCEWQLAKMNETFNTLIAVCEEKLQKLHGSDMNMAIIREQLHKEILELFWYEFQTFQRLHNAKTEHMPQFCSEYCSIADLAKHRDEYKQNTTKLFNANHQLLQRQRWLRFQLRLRLRRPQTHTMMAEAFSSTNLWAVTVPITFIITIIILIQVNKDRLATLETEKVRIETEVRTLHEHNTRLANDVQILTENLDAQQQHAKELISDKERLREKLEARNIILTKNAHDFWEGVLLNEREAQQELYEEKLERTISSLKQNGLKREWKLTSEYQKRMTEQENMRTHMNENYGKQLQKRDRRQKELEAYIRELEREGIKELEKWRMKYNVERESKESALAHVSSLEEEVTRLKVQTARLEEGIQTKTKSYKSSRPLGFLRPSQTISKEVIDSMLDDMHRQFETRLETQLADIQSKFESKCARDSEELRAECEELRNELESAHRNNVQLQARLARQEPDSVQPPQLLKKQKNKRSSHTKIGVHHAKKRLQRQISLSRDSDFRTQPEPTYSSGSGSYYGNTEYRLSDYSVWQ